jgi:flagellar biosynthesis/type III secretory pathway protein FliH
MTIAETLKEMGYRRGRKEGFEEGRRVGRKEGREEAEATSLRSIIATIHRFRFGRESTEQLDLSAVSDVSTLTSFVSLVLAIESPEAFVLHVEAAAAKGNAPRNNANHAS